MVADSRGNLYVADDNRVRKITPDGTVSTIAGSSAGYQEGDGAYRQIPWYRRTGH